MNRILTAILVLILTLGLLITGCSPPSEPEGPAEPEGPVQGPRIGKLAPDFRLPNLEGQSISLSDFRGKPVLINFWASWCGPCLYEMPFIQEIFEEWSDQGLVILAIDMGESLATVKDFLQSHNFSFPVLLDIDQDVALEYNIRGIPTTFFIDKDGIIREIFFGAFPDKEIIERKLSKIIT